MKRILKRSLVVTGLIVLGWFATSRRAHTPPIPKELQDRLVLHVASSDSQAHELMEGRLAELKRQIVQRRDRCDAFADQMLSWSAKITLAKEGIGLTAKGAHEQFVRQAFAAQVITTDELRQLVAQTTEGFERDLQAIQNELLVRLRQDIQDVPGNSSSSDRQTAQIVESLEAVILTQPAASVSASQQEVIAFAASTVLAEALTPIAIEVMTSAGLLTAGAVSAPESLGIGLGVAVAVDIAYSKITDPAGKLSAILQNQLGSLADAIIAGQPTQPGLRGQLESMLQHQVSTNQEILAAVQMR